MPLRHSLATPRYATVPPAAQSRFGVWSRPCGIRHPADKLFAARSSSRRRSAPCRPLRCLAERETPCLNLSRLSLGGAHGVQPFAALIPSGRLWSLTAPLIPPAVRFNVRLDCFYRGFGCKTDSSYRGQCPSFTHSYEQPTRASKTQLPGFSPTGRSMA